MYDDQLKKKKKVREKFIALYKILWKIFNLKTNCKKKTVYSCGFLVSVHEQECLNRISEFQMWSDMLWL